ncbi:hypothetical protein BGZ63DRAFT_428024 [Mariannaea sp. PMI_226]|nr:hypothetical protein BGZ63DRAFT_428024 [Mariannaea sp. PMI_226]
MPAPYADNLYSTAELSDDEVDALSPTDGYFHASSQQVQGPSLSSSSPPPPQPETSSQQPSFHHSIPNVPRRSNVLVEDPTLDGPAAKDREAQSVNTYEADVEASAASAGWSRYSSSDIPTWPSHNYNNNSQSPLIGQGTSSPYNQPSVTHSSPFPHHHDAPPAYTPSPTSPPSSGYQTFGPSSSTMGLPEEQQRLIPHSPESMGGPINSPNQSRWQRIRGCMPGPNLRKKLQTLLGVLVVISIILALVGGLTGGHGRHPKKPNRPDFSDGQPIKHPNMDQDGLKWDPNQGCRNDDLQFYNISYAPAWSSDRNLKIVQEIEKNGEPGNGRSPRVSGEVVVRPTDAGSVGSVDIEIITNDRSINVHIGSSDDGQQITVTTPRQVSWDSSPVVPCIQIRITVWAPQEAALENFGISTVQLNILVEEQVNIDLVNTLLAGTVTGNVKTPPFSAKQQAESAVAPYKLNTREIRISTVSGDVKGWYPLFDKLEIKTTSGDIMVDVTPKPADPEHVKPAALSAFSHSGTVVVEEVICTGSNAAVRATSEQLPARDYTVGLVTTSGDITAKLAVSSYAHIKSQSGELEVILQPVLDSEKLLNSEQKPLYKTETTSGDVHFRILEPLWTGKNAAGSPAFGSLTSKHTSVSGDIKLAYPGSWEGHLRASTLSGSQHVSGDGLKIDVWEEKPWSKKIEAHKGKGGSQMEVESVSGSEEILIGK